MSPKSSKKRMNSSSKPARKPDMRITKRLVNTKRHTVGYVINGKKYTVAKARAFATQGRIHGVRVVGNHIQSIPGRKKLTRLATAVERK